MSAPVPKLCRACTLPCACHGFRFAAHCFQSTEGHPAAQGFVTALLHDKQAEKHVLVAVTHLKAKAGADNEQTRVHQVRRTVQNSLTHVDCVHPKPTCAVLLCARPSVVSCDISSVDSRSCVLVR